MVDYDPYDRLDPVPSFTLTSDDLTDGDILPVAQRDTGAGGTSTSPHLSWSGFPPQTKSFAITCFDPDAPTPSGFWHWAVYNLPSSITSLETGAGSAGGNLPPRTRMLKNEYRRREFVGAQPPEDTGEHRYMFVVHAVDVDSLDLDPESTPTVLAFNLHYHTLARAIMTNTASANDAPES